MYEGVARMDQEKAKGFQMLDDEEATAKMPPQLRAIYAGKKESQNGKA